jgi:uncharacterized membrane protein
MMADAFERAAQRVESQQRRRDHERSRQQHSRIQRTGFRIHATAYVAVQILIFAIWVIVWRLGGTAHPWFVYPLLGWGIGLAVHYAAVRDSWRSLPATHTDTQPRSTETELP